MIYRKIKINYSNVKIFFLSKFVLLSENCKDRWTFHDALFFSGTLATTIGYGNLTPETLIGKVSLTPRCRVVSVKTI